MDDVAVLPRGLPDFPLPDARGRFGRFGGRYVPETLVPALQALEAAYREAKADPAFVADLRHVLREYVGRPSPLYLAANLTRHLGGARVYLKREDLRSEEHTSELQSRENLVCRLLLEKK